MRTIIATALFIVTTVTPSHALGQRLGAGDMINIRPSRSVAPERRWGAEQPSPTWTEATVVRLANDTLWYSVGRNVAQMSVTDGDVRRPTGRDHRWLTATVAGVTGATVVGLIVYATFEPEYSYGSIGAALVCSSNNTCRRPPQSNNRTGDAAVGALTGAIMGSMVGYLVGKRLGRWESVDFTPTLAEAGGLALAVRVGL